MAAFFNRLLADGAANPGPASYSDGGISDADNSDAGRVESRQLRLFDRRRYQLTRLLRLRWIPLNFLGAFRWLPRVTRPTLAPGFVESSSRKLRAD